MLHDKRLALIGGGKVGAILDCVVMRDDIGVLAHITAVGRTVMVAAVIAAGEESIADRSFDVEEIPIFDRIPFCHVETDAAVGNGWRVFDLPTADGTGLRDLSVG